MVLPGSEFSGPTQGGASAPSHISTQTLWPGTHQSAECACDTARLPRTEAGCGDRAQMAGDVLINSMWEGDTLLTE